MLGRPGTIALLLLPLLAPALPAQEPDSTRRDTIARDVELDERTLPREIARRVTDVFNAPGTLRVSGSLDVAADRTIDGDVAVLEGPLTIAGRTTGSVIAINTDVALRPSARIDGDLVVVGGIIEGKHAAYIGGDIVSYRQRLRYDEEGGRIVTERNAADDDHDDRWWRRMRRRSRTDTGIHLSSGGTYNRVEGLPIHLGPTYRRDFGETRLELEALGILRTADEMRWDSRNVGHAARAELRVGRPLGLAVGGRLYDVVDGVEEWQLTDTEVGLASFLLHRDFRDYYDRHGGTGYVSIVASDDARLSVSLSDERWGRRTVRDPLTLFRDSNPWRANPLLDEGSFHLANATFTVDTRNNVDNPWAGWYVVADYERGSGRVTAFGASSPGVRDTSDRRLTYDRAFLDLRRYNRISPSTQLNMRVVLGGWVSGDQLPMQRRFSVGGPGSVPGFDFRDLDTRTDVGQCSMGAGPAPAGRPAECERMALAQIEYRGDLDVDWMEEDDRHERWKFDFRMDGAWVVFADAGRGWLIGEPVDGLRYAKGDFPSLGTFRTDVGAGFDFGGLGIYIAKSVSDSSEPANFFVRVRKRF